MKVKELLKLSVPFVLALLIVSCNKQDEVLITSVLESSDSELSEFETPVKLSLDYEYLKDLYSDEVDTQGISWRSRAKSRKIKNEILTKWANLIEISGLSREELTPVYDKFFNFYQFKYKEDFFSFKYIQLWNIFHKRVETNRYPYYRWATKTSNDFDCEDLEQWLASGISETPFWVGYGSTFWDDNKVLGEFRYSSKKKIVSNNDKIPFLNRQKIKIKTLDKLIRIVTYSGYSAEDFPLSHFYAYPEYTSTKDKDEIKEASYAGALNRQITKITGLIGSEDPDRLQNCEL